jgi:hypothetical protein
MKIKFKEWLKQNEMAGTDAIVGSCKPHADYQVWGACSDLKKQRKKKKGKK